MTLVPTLLRLVTLLNEHDESRLVQQMELIDAVGISVSA